jgi:hypothetical protein
MKWKLALCCLLLLFAFASCASKKDEEEQTAKDDATKEKKEAEAKEAVDTYKPHLICPQVAIIHELELAKDYGNEKPAADQLVAAARMKKIEGTCSYQEEGIDIEFTLHLAALKGPRLGTARMAFPYFVALVDPDQTILDKNQMSVEFKFGDDKTADQDVPLHVFIPLPKDKKETGPGYRVLTGFQLTQEQLSDVRAGERAAVGLPATPATATATK